MEVKATAGVTSFELMMMERFIKHSLRTTFPEFRQKFIKAVKQFIIRLRTSFDKNIKKFVQSSETEIPQSLTVIHNFLKDTVTFV